MFTGITDVEASPDLLTQRPHLFNGLIDIEATTPLYIYCEIGHTFLLDQLTEVTRPHWNIGHRGHTSFIVVQRPHLLDCN